ncbi:MAG: type II toxin-antitoxin system RelB/DinJ family antitoxin [Lachnospiraceae bacterium]|nr:type II toxin-antitoxin system RelB/DinJ family antitoxin [Lachnospiraceae bacterium]
MVNVNVRMNETDRDLLANFCNNVGMSISTLFNVFAKKVINENRIPFNIEYEDPYFSGGNKAFLDKGIAALNAGKGVEHELIEDNYA